MLVKPRCYSTCKVFFVHLCGVRSEALSIDGTLNRGHTIFHYGINAEVLCLVLRREVCRRMPQECQAILYFCRTTVFVSRYSDARALAAFVAGGAPSCLSMYCFWFSFACIRFGDHACEQNFTRGFCMKIAASYFEAARSEVLSYLFLHDWLVHRFSV